METLRRQSQAWYHWPFGPQLSLRFWLLPVQLSKFPGEWLLSTPLLASAAGANVVASAPAANSRAMSLFIVPPFEDGCLAGTMAHPPVFRGLPRALRKSPAGWGKRLARACPGPAR